MNCLSVDFDIIMRPTIELYNDLVDDYWTVQSIEDKFPIISAACPPDMEIYKYLTEFLITQIKVLNVNKIFFITHHKQAAKLLEGYEEIHLCNIDHHHDVGYENVKPLTKILKPDDGNWVKYLKDKKIVTYYSWIHNSNSDFPDNRLTQYIDKEYELSHVFLSEAVPSIDILILCHSPEWIPKKWDNLWQIWLSIFNTWYDTEFDIL